MTQKSKPVLLIEDDNVDAMMVKRAFEELRITNPLVHLISGEEGLEYLKDGNNEKPDLILLDLNMPKMSGIEFLKIIKADEALRKIPVAVLTISKEEQDIVESFRLGAAGYIVKPVDYGKFAEAIRIINQYWAMSRLPSER